MNLKCLAGGHDEECGLLDKEGIWYKATHFEVPENGILIVYWKCQRCGRLRQSVWGSE